jgi:two-component system response regulator NreC
MAIRVLIVDDHGIVRAGLRALLSVESDLTIVGEAADGEQALRLARTLQPDVVLMDISMPGMDGLEATRALTQSQPAVKVLILSLHEDSALVRAALEAGAAGYVVKRGVEGDVISAIRAAVRGDLYLHPAVTRALLAKDGPASEFAGRETLSPREIEVLRLIAAGHTNREIAERLVLSVRTVESHRANLMGKLGLHSRAELVQYAASRDLLDPAETATPPLPRR